MLGNHRVAAEMRRCGGLAYRVENPDFNIRQLNTHAVLRREYRPGSTLFVVCSQNRSDFEADGRFHLRRYTGDLFRARAPACCSSRQATG